MRPFQGKSFFLFSITKCWRKMQGIFLPSIPARKNTHNRKNLPYNFGTVSVPRDLTWTHIFNDHLLLLDHILHIYIFFSELCATDRPAIPNLLISGSRNVAVPLVAKRSKEYKHNGRRHVITAAIRNDENDDVFNYDGFKPRYLNQFSPSLYFSLSFSFPVRLSSCTPFIRLPSMNEFENVKQSSPRPAAHPPIFGSDARPSTFVGGENYFGWGELFSPTERTASHPALFHIERY